MARASQADQAQRLNLARRLLRQSHSRPQAAKRLARSCAISTRQAYRYLEQAEALQAPLRVPDAKIALTIKLSQALVQRLRRHARASGATMSETISQALIAALPRGGGRERG